MHKVRSVPLVVALTSILSGCSLIGIGNDTAPACTGFDIAHNTEVLGSGARLQSELETAAKKPGPVRLGDITHAAGWSDDWTRMVYVGYGTTTRELNRDTQIGESCWQGLPPLPDGDGHPPVTYYLFVKGVGTQGRPVQSVNIPFKHPGLLTMDDRRALTAESMLIASGTKLSPQP